MNIYKKVSILSAIVFLILNMQSCYKIKTKSLIYGTVCCVDTNNIGISGIKYRIYEKKHKYDNPKSFIEGETDQNGVAHFEFKPPSSSKWNYYIQVLPSSIKDYPIVFTTQGHNYMFLFRTIDDLDERKEFNLNDPSTYSENDLVLVLN